MQVYRQSVDCLCYKTNLSADGFHCTLIFTRSNCINAMFENMMKREYETGSTVVSLVKHVRENKKMNTRKDVLGASVQILNYSLLASSVLKYLA